MTNTVGRISPQLWLGCCHAQLDWADVFAKVLRLLVHEVMFRPTQYVHDTLAYAYVWLRHSLWYRALGRSCWWPALHIQESIMWLGPTGLHAERIPCYPKPTTWTQTWICLFLAIIAGQLEDKCSQITPSLWLCSTDSRWQYKFQI